MTPLRILIADDHPLFRKGMRTLLASMPKTEVVGEATTGKEAVDRALALQDLRRRCGRIEPAGAVDLGEFGAAA